MSNDVELSGIGSGPLSSLRDIEGLLREIESGVLAKSTLLPSDQQARVARLVKTAMEFVVFAQSAEEPASMDAVECLAQVCREIANALHV